MRHYGCWELCEDVSSQFQRGSPWRKSCPNLTLIPLPLNWNAGAPCASRPSGPQSQQSQQSQRADLLAWGCRRGRVRTVIAAICSQCLPSPNGRPGRPGRATAFFRSLVGERSAPPPWLARTVSLRLCLIESNLEGMGLSLPGSLINWP